MTEIDMRRRQLLKAMGMAAVASSVQLNPSGAYAATDTLMSEHEPDWDAIRALYPVQAPFTNLDNGCISPPILAVQDKLIEAYKFANLNPCYNMFEILDKAVPGLKVKLAKLADCDPDEIAINRCTTVGMSTAILGMPLKAGDEVILSDWDYPSMTNAWKQRAARDGVVLRKASFGLMDSDDAIAAAYINAITSKTQAIHITHMIHWCGRVLPMEEICRVARQRDIRTVIDAAQSFAHIPFSFRETGCDYLATSFHKWLSGPIGTGMLIIRADRIEETWPLFPIYEELSGADKFGMSNLGTYHSADPYALEDAVDFHTSIGIERKQKRLQTLSRYWVEQALEIPGFRVHTPIDHPKLGGLVTFSIDGVPIQTIEARLRDEFNIQTRLRNPPGLQGIRVSPQLYSQKSDLDALVQAIRIIANVG